MPHKLLLGATCLVWTIVTLFTVAADSNGKVDRSRLPGEYGYLASQWSGRIEVPIVLLEKIR